MTTATTQSAPPPQAGHAALDVGVVFGESTVTSAVAVSPMKLLTPRSRGRSAWVYTSSFGGGLVAGDQTRLELRIGAGARCFVGTQSSTKVYRNPNLSPCGHATHATLKSDSLLVFTPEPVQAFADAVYSQQQEFQLEPGASLALLDWFSSGRSAINERWMFTGFQSRNDVFVGGSRVFIDSVLLDPEDGPVRSQHGAGRYNAFAMLLLLGPILRNTASALLAKIASRPVERHASLIAVASPVADGAVLRVAGQSPESVTRLIHEHLRPLSEFLGDDPWARKF